MSNQKIKFQDRNFKTDYIQKLNSDELASIVGGAKPGTQADIDRLSTSLVGGSIFGCLEAEFQSPCHK